MALPTQPEQLSLEFVIDGMPYVNVAGNSNIIADGIHFTINGAPYYATSPGGSTPVYNTTQFFLLF